MDFGLWSRRASSGFCDLKFAATGAFPRRHKCGHLGGDGANFVPVRATIFGGRGGLARHSRQQNIHNFANGVASQRYFLIWRASRFLNPQERRPNNPALRKLRYYFFENIGDNARDWAVYATAVRPILQALGHFDKNSKPYWKADHLVGAQADSMNSQRVAKVMTQ